MRSLVIGLSLVLIGMQTAQASPKAIERRVSRSTEVFTDRMDSAEPIPQNILDAAECIASVRNVTAGFIIGGESSWGLVSCRVGKEWSAPSFFNAGGGKLGLLVGGKVSDNVLVFLSSKARKSLNGASIKLGVDLSIAAGPISAGGALPTEDIVVYSAGSGFYLGFSLDGTVISHAAGKNAEVYGRSKTVTTILATEGSKAPAVVKPYIDELEDRAP